MKYPETEKELLALVRADFQKGYPAIEITELYAETGIAFDAKLLQFTSDEPKVLARSSWFTRKDTIVQLIQNYVAGRYRFPEIKQPTRVE